LASEARGLKRDLRNAMLGERHTPLSLIITYAPISLLYAASWVFVFNGPFTGSISWLWPWIPNYLVVGVGLGLTVIVRQWIRGWLAAFARRFKRGTRESRSPLNPNSTFEDLATFGVTLGLLAVVVVSLRFALLYVLTWVLAVPFEVGLWTEFRNR